MFLGQVIAFTALLVLAGILSILAGTAPASSGAGMGGKNRRFFSEADVVLAGGEWPGFLEVS
ncbi:MAG: hypothetical protein QOH40_2986, partial [Arthrobacter pascens]|nr:hypothetical protein [Arthrobacter pascens]